MKKVLSLIVVVVFTAASVAFAQDTKSTQTKTVETKTVQKTAPATKTASTTMSHECYMMKDGALMHCTGDKAVAQKETVKLKNGTVISTEGEVTSSEGKKSKLENGQCVSMMGSVGDCEKMHANMKENMMKKEKMGEVQPQTK